MIAAGCFILSGIFIVATILVGLSDRSTSKYEEATCHFIQPITLNASCVRGYWDSQRKYEYLRIVISFLTTSGGLAALPAFYHLADLYSDVSAVAQYTIVPF